MVNCNGQPPNQVEGEILGMASEEKGAAAGRAGWLYPRRPLDAWFYAGPDSATKLGQKLFARAQALRYDQSQQQAEESDVQKTLLHKTQPLSCRALESNSQMM